MQQKLKTMAGHKEIWPLVALILILLYNLLFTPGFFSLNIRDGKLFGSLIDIMKHASPLIILSIGMTLVIATEGIDLSVGAVIAISASVACSLLAGGTKLFLAIGLALLTSSLCGLWNGILVAKIGIQPMVGTLILMTIGRGIAQLITQGQIITINHEAYSFIGNGYLGGLPFAVYIALLIIIGMYFLLRHTSLGLFLEAVGTNRVSSRFAGINASSLMMVAYIFSGFFAGLAGIFISSNVTAADANNAGLWLEIDAILASVIGGTSMSGGRIYLVGTVMGAIFIQTLTTTIYSTGVAPEIILVVKAMVVMMVSLLQSSVFRGKIFAALRGGRMKA